MKRLVPLVVLAFTAGGVVAPAAHRAVHAAEATAERRAHQLAGHHHHEGWTAHGTEWTLPCDRPVELDELACVLCKGLSAGAPNEARAYIDRPRQVDAVPTVSRPAATRADEAALARGPPLRLV